MIDPAQYDYLSSFLLGSSGLSLGPNKEYLLESRLIPLAQSMGLEGIPELVNNLRSKGDKNLEEAVVEAMTTNETSFFRDNTPFENMKNIVIPELMEKRAQSKSLRIWCAAGSTGQEPYSLAMMLNDEFPELSNWRVEITVTDISQQALDRAKSGVYSQFEVQRGLPVKKLVKYFEQNEQGWKIKDDLKQGFVWKHFNLLDSFRGLGTFDMILCRNVLIYFENVTKKDILDRMRKQLADDGCLFLGAAETILGITDSFMKKANIPKSSVYIPAVAEPGEDQPKFQSGISSFSR